MATEIVEEMKNGIKNRKTIQCIATSFQIKLEAQYRRLKVVDESRIP
jgi:hypothetical protein